MNYFVKISFVVICILASSCTGKSMEQEILNLPATDINKQDIAPGKILIRFKPGTGPDLIKIIQEKYGLKTEKPMGIEGLYLMINKGEISVEDIINELKKYNEVMYAEPDYKYRIDDN